MAGYVLGNAIERFAALANKTVEELILEWIKDKLDHATVQALRDPASQNAEKYIKASRHRGYLR